MTIASAIQNAQQKVQNAYTAVSNKGGTLPATQDLSNLPTAIGSISTGGTIETLNVTPITSAQTITATGGVDGYSPVNVSAVTSSIDSNIQPQYIRNGVVILSVTGTYGQPLPPPVVACSGNTTWYLDTNGDLYGCGWNSRGQQGSGNTTNITVFTKRAENVSQFACSDSTTWYIDTNGDLYGCGWNSYGQQGSGDTTDVLTFTKRAENIVQVACSDITTWYLDTNGDLYGCGIGEYGQQGNGTSGSSSKVTTFTKRAENVIQIACPADTTWYIDSNGDLYGCGKNNYGQQGSGGTSNVTTFTKRASNVSQIICSGQTTWYIDSNGDLYGCGRNYEGQIGTGNTSNVKTFTKRAENIIQFACSPCITWYIDSNGDLYGCGSNRNGQQGNGTSGSGTNLTTFTKRAENVVQVACSVNGSEVGTTWYIDSNGDLYGCGSNGSGQQGSGNTNNVTTFTKRGENVVQVVCSTNTTWYTTIQDIYGCGQNNNGQQGSGNTTNVLTFTKRN